MTKAHAHSWEVTDEFWKRVEPLVPQPVRDPTKQATPIGIRGDHICAAHGLPVEGTASRSFWQR